MKKKSYEQEMRTAGKVQKMDGNSNTKAKNNRKLRIKELVLKM